MNLLLNILTTTVGSLIVIILTPAMLEIGELIKNKIKSQYKAIPQSLSNLISNIPYFLVICFVILFSNHLSLSMPRNTINFGNETFIKYDSQNHVFSIFKEGLLIFEHSPLGYGKSVIKE